MSNRADRRRAEKGIVNPHGVREDVPSLQLVSEMGIAQLLRLLPNSDMAVLLTFRSSGPQHTEWAIQTALGPDVGDGTKAMVADLINQLTHHLTGEEEGESDGSGPILPGS